MQESNVQSEDLLSQIQEELKAQAEEAYRSFSQSLLPGVEDLLGVRLPRVRGIAKRYAKPRERAEVVLDGLESRYAAYCTENGARSADKAENAAENRALCMEERLVWGFVIGYAKLTTEERKRRIGAFLPAIDNWSVCDSCCNTYKFMREEPDSWWMFLKPLFRSSEIYTLRFAAVCGFLYFKTEGYIEELLELLTGIQNDAYYVQMAQAWALSMCYVSFSNKVEEILKRGILSDMVQNKTIQKIRESLQVDREAKEAIVRYRRK